VSLWSNSRGINGKTSRPVKLKTFTHLLTISLNLTETNLDPFAVELWNLDV
jgi:hypothetical protein